MTDDASSEYEKVNECYRFNKRDGRTNHPVEMTLTLLVLFNIFISSEMGSIIAVEN